MTRIPIDNLGIPPLAGIGSYEEASREGYSVDGTVALLKRYNFVLSCLNQIAAAHIPAVAEWEVKCALSLHLWLDAEHAAALRQRVTEMREPPHHLDKAPDRKLDAWLDETIRAEDTLELLVGVYQVARTALIDALEKHLAEANPLADYPTCRLLRQIVLEQQEMLDWGRQAVSTLSQTVEAAERAREWQTQLQAYLQRAGGITGDLLSSDDAQTLLPGRSDGKRFEMDVIPRRDSRFTSSFDQSFSAGVSGQLSEDLPADERAFVLLHRRLQEMDVPEWMAPIIYKTRGKPWEYYREMSRQLWDEARHAMMGEVGLYALGIPFYKYPIALEGSMTLNQEFDPLESHVLLWEIEQRLMQRTSGKRFELEVAETTGDSLIIRFQDFDWADEVLHAQIGRRWLLTEVGDLKALHNISQELRPRWHESMNKLKESAEPLDWWPDFVAEARTIQEGNQVGKDA